MTLLGVVFGRPAPIKNTHRLIVGSIVCLCTFFVAGEVCRRGGYFIMGGVFVLQVGIMNLASLTRQSGSIGTGRIETQSTITLLTLLCNTFAVHNQMRAQERRPTNNLLTNMANQSEI
jgi:hypothetical protein